MQTFDHTSPRELGAVIKDEYNENFTRKAGVFVNSTAAVIMLQPGTLFVEGDAPEIYNSADVKPVTGINLTSCDVQPGATVNVTWLEKGPAIVNVNELDLPDNAAQQTTIKAELEAMNLKLVEGLD